MKKYIFWTLFFLSIYHNSNKCLYAAELKILPETIGESLVAEFSPDAVLVKVKNHNAWIEINGGIIDGIRIENMKLLAILHEVSDQKLGINSLSSLAQMIKSSKGEVILTEKDINKYFNENKNPDGFSDLHFDFKKEGFSASGRFRTKIIVNLELPISAKGQLRLYKEGVYLKNTVITVEGITQPDMLTNIILSKINPLLEFKEIPFSITFEKIIMTEEAAIMTGILKEFMGGKIWKWEKP